jgi:hypothetical protein
MTDATREELERGKAKPRPRGTLPYPPDNREDVAALRAWLTLAFRPPKGWAVQSFERAGRNKRDPCSLIVANGRESKKFRFAQQHDICKEPRTTIISASDSWLYVPHLTGGEVGDVWAVLCALGDVLTEWDEIDQTREWIEQELPVTMPLNGYTLVPDGRHAGLMAIKGQGEFTKSDALSLMRGGEDVGYQQRPTRFVDSQTGAQYLRTGETACYLRWVVGVEPLSHATLKARLHEIGVVGRWFEDYRPPHPKLRLYQLSDALIEVVR